MMFFAEYEVSRDERELCPAVFQSPIVITQTNASFFFLHPAA